MLDLMRRAQFTSDAYCLSKFGRNPDIDTGDEDVTNIGGIYPGFPTGAAETIQVFSSSVNDTSAGTGMRTCTLFGLDGSYNFQTETFTLNGTTPVTSSTTWSRMFRLRIGTAGSVGTNAGTITVRHSSTTANVFCAVPVGFGSTQLPLFTVPAGYTAYLLGYDVAINDTNSNNATVGIWAREFGKGYAILYPSNVSTAVPGRPRLDCPAPFPEKTDLSIRVISVQNPNADIVGRLNLVLFKN